MKSAPTPHTLVAALFLLSLITTGATCDPHAITIMGHSGIFEVTTPSFVSRSQMFKLTYAATHTPEKEVTSGLAAMPEFSEFVVEEGTRTSANSPDSSSKHYFAYEIVLNNQHFRLSSIAYYSSAKTDPSHPDDLLPDFNVEQSELGHRLPSDAKAITLEVSCPKDLATPCTHSTLEEGAKITDLLRELPEYFIERLR